MNNMDPRRYYDAFGEEEWERLTANPVARLEFENTTRYLAERLPENGPVLDAGGGPGRYAIWLAERGHEVAHLDPSREQVRIAREKANERGVDRRVRFQQGDVRALPFGAGRFAAVCCLGGPLSHVLDPGERKRALRELRRVAREDASVFVSVMGRLAALRFAIKHASDHHGLLEPLAETGDYTQELVERHADGEGWAEMHAFRVEELEGELEAAGLTVETLVGLEGVASAMQPALAELPEDGDALTDVHAVVSSLREDRAVVDASEHILTVCRA
ncbi:class I SAM-dependent methyltransferase [Halobacteriales archaeon QS_4_69_34]|nr:MAG: class I SAM-dependent methyltransferase [Halobacteriales archaeon QS_4_69_34]